MLRASGVPYDLRKLEPYGVYDKVDFDVVVGTKGDCWDRYYVRMEEMRQSLRIIEQLIDNIPAGPHMVMKYNAKIKLPKGRYYGQVETARGVLGVFIYSDGRRRYAVPDAFPFAEFQQSLGDHRDRAGLADCRLSSRSSPAWIW